MHNYQIPFVYFPLKVVFVDDNKIVLDALYKKFSQKYNCETANSSESAMQIINTSQVVPDSIFSISDSIETLHNSNDSPTNFHIDFAKVSSLISSKDKYNQIGIVVTDYDMGNQNGLDLCQQISNKNIKKILLTGQLDISKGINAMNKNVIDRYVEKTSSSIDAELNEYIEILHTIYFNQVYSINSELLKKSELFVLDDCEYIELFEDILYTYDIKEFYLIDNKGSYLMIDASHNQYILNFHTNRSLDEFVETYKDEPKISAFIESVKSRNVIPFFGIFRHPTSVDISNWSSNFYKPNKTKNFYWNLVKR